MFRVIRLRRIGDLEGGRFIDFDLSSEVATFLIGKYAMDYAVFYNGDRVELQAMSSDKLKEALDTFVHTIENGVLRYVVDSPVRIMQIMNGTNWVYLAKSAKDNYSACLRFVFTQERKEFKTFELGEPGFWNPKVLSTGELEGIPDISKVSGIELERIEASYNYQTYDLAMHPEKYTQVCTSGSLLVDSSGAYWLKDSPSYWCRIKFIATKVDMRNYEEDIKFHQGSFPIRN